MNSKKMGNKRWLAYANTDKCNHIKALKTLGYISWSNDSRKFEVGDVVFLYIRQYRRVIYKTHVERINILREDTDFWKEQFQQEVKNQLTSRLRLEKIYKGEELNEEKLSNYGYDGKSIQRPSSKNERLLSYIEQVFDRV